MSGTERRGNPRIVIVEKCGQLGNRLIHFSHWIAVAEAVGATIVNPTLDEYRYLFGSTHHQRVAQYPSHSTDFAFEYRTTNLIARLLRKSGVHLRFVSSIGTKGDSPDFDIDPMKAISSIEAKRILVFGWRFRNYELFHQYSDVIRSYFSPSPSVTEEVNQFVDDISQFGRPLIGCHIRRGDYRNFENGKYFYELSVYHDTMKRIRKMLAPADPLFVVFSNESVQSEAFPDVDWIPGPGSLGGDFFGLVRCNFIVGPPSTFSRFASFLGNVPLYVLTEQVLPSHLSQFQPALH